MPYTECVCSTPQFPKNAPILGRLGTLETRLLRSEEELSEVQKLRYQIFFEDGVESPQSVSEPMQRDADRFDTYCDHLLVLDHDEIVGTYRLLPQEQAAAAGGFYSQAEFDLTNILQTNTKLRFLELGRSCISPQYRGKRTMELLWHGTWTYALEQRSDVLFGCASFPGTDPEQFSDALAWLAAHACLPKHEHCAAVANDHFALNKFSIADQHTKKALYDLPPMLKGYLRLGAKVSSDAVIDRSFGTIDVLVVLKVADINPRYIAHYGPTASRYAV